MTVETLGAPLIVIANGPQWGQRVLLTPKEPVMIGRSPENVLPILNDQRISKSHRVVEFRAGRYWLRDLQSRNGTWLRGETIRQGMALAHGDSFRCGSTEFAFWDPETSETSTASPEVAYTLEELLRRVVRHVPAQPERVPVAATSAPLPDTLTGYKLAAASESEAEPSLAHAPADGATPASPTVQPLAADSDPVVAALQRVSLFKHLGIEQIQRLAQATQRRRYTQGSYVIRQGEEGLCMYSIVSGQVEVVRMSTRDSSEQRLASLGPGDFFGEMALFDALPRSATVRALANVECLILSRWTLTDAVRADSDVAMALLEALSQRLRAVARLI